MTKLTPLMQQYMAVKSQHPDKIVFFRMGDFYEMFGEDAVTAAPVLGIALTSRGQGGSEKTPLAGVPYHAADKYLTKLIDAGFKVAIVEQVENPKTAKGIVKRAVVEILTPGSASLESTEHNGRPSYLASLAPGSNGRIGLAYLDLSTAEFHLMDAESGKISERLSTLEPREILTPDKADSNQLESILHALQGEYTASSTDSYYFDPSSGAEELKRFLNVSSLEGYGVTESDLSVGAAAAIVRYLRENHRDRLDHITSLSVERAGEYMELDQSSIRNLELVESLSRGGDGPNLFTTIDMTLTGPGSRRLRRNLMAPFRKLKTILRRQEAVSEAIQAPQTRRNIRDSLKGYPDLERLIGKLGVRRMTPRQTLALAQALERGAEIIQKLKELKSDLITESHKHYPPDLALIGRELSARLVEAPPLSSSGGSIFRPGASDKLDQLHASISDAKSYMSGLQEDERQKTGISSLKLGFNKVFGYYLEVTHLHRDKIPEHYIRKQTLVNAERYITEEMKIQEKLILEAEEKIFRLEEELFEAELDKLTRVINDMQLAAQILAEVDLLFALAELGVERGYCKPDLTEDDSLEIVGGRHPVIETILPRGSFVPNDVSLDPEEQTVIILTGPNMAGKSTYLRQIGHIVVLAQIGSYVPADSARLGLVDRIFTRVGAVDKLAQGQSTFMVEMLETANILNNGSSNSLILLDEVGRGTSTYDGLSLAWAVVEEIHDRLKARTIFATHYHELTALAKERKRVVNYQVSVKRWEDKVIFLHKIVPGGCDDSYGIEVSRLAGMPESVVTRARKILRSLEEGTFVGVAFTKSAPANLQTSLFDSPAVSGAREDADPKLAQMADRLLKLNTNEMTPLTALQELVELQNSLENDE